MRIVGAHFHLVGPSDPSLSLPQPPSLLDKFLFGCFLPCQDSSSLPSKEDQIHCIYLYCGI
jgi:hypothetical protein